MAITILKQPALFLNCTNPAIFEFTTDSVIGNFDDYVADIFLSSAYTTKTAVVRNIFPNTNTKVFSVDVSEFLKALQLNGFGFEFEGSKNLAVEKFNLDIKVRDNSQPDSEIFSYDDYYFDNFVFTDGLSVVDSGQAFEDGIYSILGERLLFDSFNNPLSADKLTLLTPNTIEFCKDFDNYIPVFINEFINQTITVGENTINIPNTKGVSYPLVNVSGVNSLSEITTSNQNINKKVFAYPFEAICQEVIQFRFYNSKGGFSYLYAVPKSKSFNRSKVTFYENNYFNENENKSGVMQSNSDYKETIEFSGIKIIQLKELFNELLRSPKVEMNLKQINGNDLFIECEVTGSSADQYTHFDFNLTASIKNTGNFRL